MFEIYLLFMSFFGKFDLLALTRQRLNILSRSFIALLFTVSQGNIATRHFSMKALSWELQEVFCSHAPVMSRVKESSTDMDFKKLRAKIQEDEKQDAKLLAPVGD